MEEHLHWFWILLFSFLVVLLQVSLLKVVVFLWWRPKKIEKHFSKQGIKGPPYHFFWGNGNELVGLMSKALCQPMPLSHNIVPRVLSFYFQWKKIYGANFLVWFGPTARLTISDPILIREILAMKSEFYEKNEPHPHLRKLEGDGLVALKGEKWANHRKIITPTFHMENLKLMIPAMAKSVDAMLDEWSIMSTSGVVEIEISEWFRTLIEEVIAQTLFGCNHEDAKAIFKLQAQQMDFAINSFRKIIIPGCRFLPTKENRSSWKLDREVRRSIMNLIEQHRKNSSDKMSNVCPKNILDLMINASVQTKRTNATSSSLSSFTINDITEECKTFFFAGVHTTSNLLIWTTILLAMHPKWQEMAREEVLKTCGACNVPTKDDIARLKTLAMILYEVLRLYPPVVATIRRAKDDVELGGWMIPCGTELFIPIVAVHHDKGLWGLDADEFNPLRFAQGVAHAAKHPMAFIPFGLGARRCIGRDLAILQAKIAITMILQRFSFDLAPSYQHAPAVRLILYPQYGAPVIFRKLLNPIGQQDHGQQF